MIHETIISKQVSSEQKVYRYQTGTDKTKHMRQQLP